VAEKIKSWDGLKALRSQIKKDAEAGSGQIVVAVGTATCGVAAGANDIKAVIEDEVSKAGVTDVKVVPTGCYGFCYAEPMVEVRTPKGNVKYGPVDAELAKEIIQEHVLRGNVIDRAVIRQEVERA
jgi:(2Fe-2S) ferredoxin